MIGEKASNVGKEFAEQIRATNSGLPYDDDEVWLTLERLAYSKATTAKDVLALIAVARHIVNSFPEPEGTIEATTQQIVQLLQAKAIEALEPLAKERVAVYQGYEFN